MDVIQLNDKTSLVELVARIMQQDHEAEEEMVLRYQEGVYNIIYQVVRNHTIAEDLRQETLIKVLEKIRHGDVREPERLSGFICQTAKFIAIDFVRKMRSAIKAEDIDAAEGLTAPSSDPSQQLLEKEKAEVVRKVISEMTVQRDKDLLFRYYILEQEKETICADLHFSRVQFSRIIFRAHQRFRELFLKLTGEPGSDDH